MEMGDGGGGAVGVTGMQCTHTTSSPLPCHTEPMSHPSLRMILSHSSPKSNFSTPSWATLQMMERVTNKFSLLNCLIPARQLKQSAAFGDCYKMRGKTEQLLNSKIFVMEKKKNTRSY